MNDIIADDPEPPPRFPVMTGVAAGLWIAHGCIYSALLAAHYAGLIRWVGIGDCFCCLPLSSLFILMGVLTILGRMPYKELLELIGFILGIGEMYVGLLLINTVPALTNACTLTAGFLLMAAYICTAYDLDEYNRWVLARQLQNHDDDD